MFLSLFQVTLCLFFFFFKGHFGWFGIFVLVLLFGVCFLGLVWLGVFLRGLMS